MKPESCRVIYVERQPQAGYNIQTSIWLEKDGELYLDHRRVRLLENIMEYGTLAAAARNLNMAYRNAWLWVEDMNRLASSPLVEKMLGGVGGGYTKLTDEGLRAIGNYRSLCHLHANIVGRLENKHHYGNYIRLNFIFSRYVNVFSNALQQAPTSAALYPS